MDAGWGCSIDNWRRRRLRAAQLALRTQGDRTESTWFVVRCFETMPDGRERFAHSAPIFIDVNGKPLRPRKAEVEYLISRVQGEIERNKGVLSNEALAEYPTSPGRSIRRSRRRRNDNHFMATVSTTRRSRHRRFARHRPGDCRAPGPRGLCGGRELPQQRQRGAEVVQGNRQAGGEAVPIQADVASAVDRAGHGR